jgi:hypothetical protein
MDCINIKVMDLKKKIRITDTIGAHIMIQKQAVLHMVLLVCQPCDFFFDVFSGEHGDAGQRFRSFLRFLISLQRFGVLYHPGKLFIRKALSVILQLFFQFFVSLCRKALLRYQGKDRAMGVIQKIFPDQFLEISLFQSFFEELKSLQKLYFAERFRIVIKPAA